MENDKKIVSLKARAYDILVYIQNAQAELQEVNKQIASEVSIKKSEQMPPNNCQAGVIITEETKK